MPMENPFGAWKGDQNPFLTAQSCFASIKKQEEKTTQSAFSAMPQTILKESSKSPDSQSLTASAVEYGAQPEISTSADSLASEAEKSEYFSLSECYSSEQEDEEQDCVEVQNLTKREDTKKCSSLSDRLRNLSKNLENLTINIERPRKQSIAPIVSKKTLDLSALASDSAQAPPNGANVYNNCHFYGNDIASQPSKSSETVSSGRKVINDDASRATLPTVSGASMASSVDLKNATFEVNRPATTQDKTNPLKLSDPVVPLTQKPAIDAEKVEKTPSTASDKKIDESLNKPFASLSSSFSSSHLLGKSEDKNPPSEPLSLKAPQFTSDAPKSSSVDQPKAQAPEAAGAAGSLQKSEEEGYPYDASALGAWMCWRCAKSVDSTTLTEKLKRSEVQDTRLDGKHYFLLPCDSPECRGSKRRLFWIPVGKQPIKKDDPKSSVPNTQPTAGATPSATPSAGTNPFAAPPASTPAPSVNPFASSAQNTTASASSNPFAATSTNTAPAPSSNPFASQQPPQAAPFGTQPTTASSSVQNPFGAVSAPTGTQQQSGANPFQQQVSMNTQPQNNPTKAEANSFFAQGSQAPQQMQSNNPFLQNGTGFSAPVSQGGAQFGARSQFTSAFSTPQPTATAQQGQTSSFGANTRFGQMNNAPGQNPWASTLAPQEPPKNPFASRFSNF